MPLQVKDIDGRRANVTFLFMPHPSNRDPVLLRHLRQKGPTAALAVSTDGTQRFYSTFLNGVLQSAGQEKPATPVCTAFHGGSLPRTAQRCKLGAEQAQVTF